MGLSFGLPFVPCCLLKRRVCGCCFCQDWLVFVLLSIGRSVYVSRCTCRPHSNAVYYIQLRRLSTPRPCTHHAPLLPLFTPGNSYFPWNRNPFTPSSLLACVVCGLVSTYPGSVAVEEEGDNRRRPPSPTARRTYLALFQEQRQVVLTLQISFLCHSVLTDPLPRQTVR